jgi:hypothetical protein
MKRHVQRDHEARTDIGEGAALVELGPGAVPAATLQAPHRAGSGAAERPGVA